MFADAVVICEQTRRLGPARWNRRPRRLAAELYADHYRRPLQLTLRSGWSAAASQPSTAAGANTQKSRRRGHSRLP